MTDTFYSEVQEGSLILIEKACKMLRACQGIVYTCGNGGSASLADHFAEDLIGVGVRAMSLSSNAALITALGNDFGFESIYRRQLRLSSEEDILVVISTSGDSENILSAVASFPGPVIALTGYAGGKLRECSLEVCLQASFFDTDLIENEHLVFVHRIIRGLR